MDQNLEMNKKKFFSKILLFGEYGIIKNSKALVIPYKKYYGSLKFSSKLNNVQKDSNVEMDSLVLLVHKRWLPFGLLPGLQPLSVFCPIAGELEA